MTVSSVYSVSPAKVILTLLFAVLTIWPITVADFPLTGFSLLEYITKSKSIESGGEASGVPSELFHFFSTVTEVRFGSFST